MQTERLRSLFRSVALLVTAAAGSACNSVIGLDDLSVQDQPTDAGSECETNTQCVEKLTSESATGEEVAAICVKPEGRCVELLTPPYTDAMGETIRDCPHVTGEVDDDVIVLGSMFSIRGAQATTNISRQQAAMLAVQQINGLGGIPAPSGVARKLVMVSCNETANLVATAEHLSHELKIPGMVGPNTSQDTIEVTTKVTREGGTVVMTPTAVASSIAALDDDDLTWLMVPNDEQRAPLMIRQINALENQIRAERGGDVKLGIVFRDDALGTGTNRALTDLELNGRPILEQIDRNVAIDKYDPTPDNSTPDGELYANIVAKQAAFSPDIVVLAGTAEAITQVMGPLEAAWTADVRPLYVLIDSVKVPELLDLASKDDGLRRRVRGTGILPSPDSRAVYSAFRSEYMLEFEGSSATSGMGPSYDAVFSMAYAIAALGDDPVTGPNIARNLRKLTGGDTPVRVGHPPDVTLAFQTLMDGERIDLIGTHSRLAWDDNGALVGGTLEMWCIGLPNPSCASPPCTQYASSGLTFDLATTTEAGTYTQCAP
jgi:ABC-type branched-subunit amino acid transport system substrate-binding protein